MRPSPWPATGSALLADGVVSPVECLVACAVVALPPSIIASAWALTITLRHRHRRYRYRRMAPLATASLIWSLIWSGGVFLLAMVLPLRLPLLAATALTLAFAGACAVVVSRYHPDEPDSRHCIRCGYDLTGNVSGVCPECGAARS